jgi:hypothetical protein
MGEWWTAEAVTVWNSWLWDLSDQHAGKHLISTQLYWSRACNRSCLALGLGTITIGNHKWASADKLVIRFYQNHPGCREGGQVDKRSELAVKPVG